MVFMRHSSSTTVQDAAQTLPQMERINSSSLLAWYDRHQRVLPWRRTPANPYHVWLSEMMLQQTTVPVVIPYFERFIRRWPTLEMLAQASLDEVLHAWQGLGYYARARNLHRCAQVVVADHGGFFPQEAEALVKLPGIGPYTAAAISSMAFQKPATVVDGNVVRVLARVFAMKTPLPDLVDDVYPYAAQLTPTARPGDYAQALMDLGSLVCRPREALCHQCPWEVGCSARQEGEPLRYPVPKIKTEKPTLFTYAFYVVAESGLLWVRKRPPRGLLGGMWEVPTSAWVAEEISLSAVIADLPFRGEWQVRDEFVKHTFSHFHFKIRVARLMISKALALLDGQWHPLSELHALAFPSVMKKVLRAGEG